MTSLYDVLSFWPVIGNGPSQVAWQEAKLAMAVRSKNAHHPLAGIQTRHWQMLAQQSGAEGVWEAMKAMVARVEHAIDAARAQRPPGYHPRTAQAIFEGLRRQCRTWDAELPAKA